MELLRQYALSFVGLPYRWGGDDSIEGFDCSGAAQEILASVGMDPPGDQTAHGLYHHFKNHHKSRTIECGSLLFFGSPSKIVHVGFAIDNFRMVEAGGGDSRTVDRDAAVRQNAYVRVRPYTSRSDFVAAFLPLYPF